jgi:hypothetical protein
MIALLLISLSRMLIAASMTARSLKTGTLAA